MAADEVSLVPVPVSLTRARSVDEWRALGRKCAEVLDAGGFQLEAALAAGLHEKAYYRALESEDEGQLAFQSEVLPALFRQAKKAEGDAEKDIFGGEQHSGPAVTWHKWKLEKRYRKLFGDLATKVEVSGPDGAPIKHEHLHRIEHMSDSELDGEIKKLEGGG